MITKEHLEHWTKEIEYQLDGIRKEISSEKLGGTVGISVDNGRGVETSTAYVSFEYLREKSDTIKRLLQNIYYDTENDEGVN